MVSFFTNALLATVFFVFTASHLNAEKASNSPLSSPLENNKNGELNSLNRANDLHASVQKKPAGKKLTGKKKPAGKKTTKKVKPGPKKPATKGGAKTTTAHGATDATTEGATTTASST